MKTNHLLIAAAIAAFSLTTPLAFSADPSAPGKESDAVQEPSNAEATTTSPGENAAASSMSESQFEGKITSIDKTAQTITVNDKQSGSRTVHIGSDTTLKKGNEDASWSDLKEGIEVRGTWTKEGGKIHATNVKIGES